MRQLTALIPGRTTTTIRPVSGRRREADKPAVQAKAKPAFPKRRSLNEAAHKLGH